MKGPGEGSWRRVLDKHPEISGTWPQIRHWYSSFPERFNTLELQKDRLGQLSSSSISSQRLYMIFCRFSAECSMLNIFVLSESSYFKFFLPVSVYNIAYVDIKNYWNRI